MIVKIKYFKFQSLRLREDSHSIGHLVNIHDYNCLNWNFCELSSSGYFGIHLCYLFFELTHYPHKTTKEKANMEARKKDPNSDFR